MRVRYACEWLTMAFHQNGVELEEKCKMKEYTEMEFELLEFNF